MTDREVPACPECGSTNTTHVGGWHDSYCESCCKIFVADYAENPEHVEELKAAFGDILDLHSPAEWLAYFVATLLFWILVIEFLA